MKKKLLSLVLAGAMVASTSVSAFADDTVTTDGGQTNVTIKGSVDSNDGTSPSGTISVSVPTSLGFSVNSEGKVSGGNIKIVNNSIEAVEVKAINFYDTTPTSGITVKTPDQLTTLNSEKRSNVVLSIGGTNGDRAFFKSEDAGSGEKGIYDSTGTKQPEGIKVATINGSGNSDTLTLSGYAGTQSLDDEAGEKGVTDEFRLTLKISKVSN